MNRYLFYGVRTSVPPPDDIWHKLQATVCEFQRLYDWTHDPITLPSELNGLVNIQNNELNARLTLCFVLEASRLLPNRVWYLLDTGVALYCPLLICNGQAKPSLAHMRWYLQHHDPDPRYRYYQHLVTRQWSYGDHHPFLRPFLWEEPDRRSRSISTPTHLGDTCELLDMNHHPPDCRIQFATERVYRYPLTYPTLAPHTGRTHACD